MPKNVQEPKQEIENVTYEFVHNNTFHVLCKLREILPKHGTIVIYGIPRGGLIPATILSHALERERPTRLVTSLANLDPSDWHRLVIVDELVDSGDTIKSLKTRYPEAITVALYQRATAKYEADVVGLTLTHDKWLKFPWERL